MLCSIAKPEVATYLQIVKVFTVNGYGREAIFGTRVTAGTRRLKKARTRQGDPGLPQPAIFVRVTTTKPKFSKSQPQSLPLELMLEAANGNRTRRLSRGR
jgi:hypothetical protein